MRAHFGDEKGFFSLIGILLALALLFFGVYYIINSYFAASPVTSALSGPSSAGTGSPSAAGYQSVISSTKGKIEEMNRKTLDQIEQIDALKK